jgi:CheY-like chemotaxis protein
MREGFTLRGRALRCWLALFLAGFAAAAAGQVTNQVIADPEVSPPARSFTFLEVQKRRTLDGLERHRVRVNIPDAARGDAPWFVSGRREARPQISLSHAARLAMAPESHWQDYLLALATVFTGILIFRKVLAELAGSVRLDFNAWCLSPAVVANLSAKVRAEEDAFAAFVSAFRVGAPSAPPPASAPAAAVEVPGAEGWSVSIPGDYQWETNPVANFFASSSAWLAELRALLQDIGRCEEEARRRSLLCALRDDFGALKGMSGITELLPVWQLASALEGLVEQLVERMNNVSPSTMRTVANGVDLLTDLCKPGLKADLCTDPPIKLLVVDDDPISLRAVSYALRRAFNQPDLAADGLEALALATDCAYDAIFLDVQMPGMDGFDVCSKIHETSGNASTPVVFVTCMSDFDSRAKAILTGGDDLIGKPFLSFEITVKALTFALRRRLGGANIAKTQRPLEKAPAGTDDYLPASENHWTEGPAEARGVTSCAPSGEAAKSDSDRQANPSAEPATPSPEPEKEADHATELIVASEVAVQKASRPGSTPRPSFAVGDPDADGSERKSARGGWSFSSRRRSRAQW